ncbi:MULTISPECIES: hypothetical protein [Halobacterium]|uniref:YapH protein n=4 Tax=Halobacterium salinarum TaxID=2242 RepID=Q9HMR9_HALSA|nr:MULTISPECIES: hypothetical protein [Halobacterium]AAG20502.1 hypothetical protein VNG_2415H [Halobacterium salinarum NRC-1]MBB6089567.1 hypothetical protein [Halobacterium salinarum]MCF2164316.1 hypothetical protein [Halobacterium salinarum]MCF2167103.1 hypothetical protein [Halobacterium salinarum]MCF2208194.1 hypothetical protein [Halobacterium salinarum]
MIHYEVVVALKTLTLALGGAVTYFAAKAWRRTSSPALRSLTIGFGFVTLGSLLAGGIDVLLNLQSNFAVLTESALTAIGFAVIVYSLYAE